MKNETTGMILWKVRYGTCLSSSSGMTAYTSHEEKTGHVATHGDSIKAVEDSIKESLSCRTSLTKIHEATYLGRLI